MKRSRSRDHGDDDHHDPPFTHSLALARTRDATVAFGDGHGALDVPIERRIAQYLQRNRYTPLIVDAPLVPLHGTTSQALHDEVMAIRVPFHLVLTDLGEGNIMESFLKGCKHVVSCFIYAPNITYTGSSFLSDCTSLLSFNTSGLTSVTTIGGRFLYGCTSLSSFDTSGLTSVTTIANTFICDCTSLASFNTPGLTSVTTIGCGFLGGCTSLTAQPTAKDVLEGRLGPVYRTPWSCAVQ